MNIKCLKCNKKPNEIVEYVQLAKEENITPEQFVIKNEGTFNKETGYFCAHNVILK